MFWALSDEIAELITRQVTGKFTIDYSAVAISCKLIVSNKTGVVMHLPFIQTFA